MSTDDKWQKGLAGVGAGGQNAPLAGGMRLDDWYNTITGIGVTGKDKRQAGAFVATVVNDAEAMELWRGDDIAARVVETIPNEMLRQGFEVRIAEERKPSKRAPGEPAEPGAHDETYGEATARGDALGWMRRRKARRDAEEQSKDLQEQIAAKLEDLGLASKLYDALCYERAYGGAAVLLGVKDGATDLKQPLKPEARIRSLDYLTVLEPRECQPIAWYNDPRKAKFGDPAIYQINPQSPGGATTTTLFQVHESRLIVFGGIKVTKRPMYGVVSGWGDSVLTRVTRVLRDYNMSWASTGVLLNDFSQSVIKIKGLAEVMAGNGAEKLRARMQAVELSRSIAHAVLIDAEEEYERKATPVTGLEALLDRFSSRLAAACDMPLTLLMGQSPKGLGNEGDSDIRFFYDRVKSMQDRKLRPVLERLVKMLFQVLGAAEPDSWSIHFCPLWQASDLEAAQARKTQAETDNLYVTMGALSPAEVAKSRFGSDEFSFQTSVDWEAREAGEEHAPAPVKSAAEVEKEKAEADAAAAEFGLKAKEVDAKTSSLRKPE
jgi:phage-related protein (TIGR01555 family)